MLTQSLKQQLKLPKLFSSEGSASLPFLLWICEGLDCMFREQKNPDDGNQESGERILCLSMHY